MADTTTDKPLNRRQQAKARTRQRVLDAAERLFTGEGYDAATIRRIADVAGMSTGAVFANFDSKADLWRALNGHAPISPADGARLARALASLVTGQGSTVAATQLLDAVLPEWRDLPGGG
jgi:AcrR family transcriptional regulator